MDLNIQYFLISQNASADLKGPKVSNSHHDWFPRFHIQDYDLYANIAFGKTTDCIRIYRYLEKVMKIMMDIQAEWRIGSVLGP